MTALGIGDSLRKAADSSANSLLLFLSGPVISDADYDDGGDDDGIYDNVLRTPPYKYK